ncbi:DMSO/TMAO reductase YedYZ molybdopterin-dependent catalytic subunit [Amycolatopsis lexingtonensis]|uniref:DMSO/TMAO reductase YedYZ molybdopterin-dependent catalytic subunit n=1 Tax=Amycolatopsis lexingtonensis TaxID=218822 RepID=A0ABR9I7I0_9PSEU|nr:molybdopterin-dependent oxidoreductase [Amycolatopsis lexingtonensis]MBE1499149.1 DMSO/TMAO reductase YedYZ molybdopterin-dependent catalytic subunit [Amycolatopsis lexingtonensis]
MSTLQDAPPEAPRRLSLPVATLIGILALAAALGVGHLVAGFVGYTASPFIAVANYVIDHSPTGIVKWAERTLGTWDKPVLKVGLAVVLVLFALLAGQLSRRTPRAGQILVFVLGAAGVAAVFARSDLGQVSLLAPVAALVAGLAVFTWLHRIALPPDVVDDRGFDRRKFLRAGVGVVAGSGVAAVVGQVAGTSSNAEESRATVGPLVPARTAPPLPADADFAKLGSPPFITPNGDFYRIDTALVVPQIRTEDWSLRIHGMVDREVTFSYADIRNRPLVERRVTLTCVSNEVGGPLISNASWIGVDLVDLLDEAGVRAGAEQMFATSVDGWTCGTPANVALDPQRGAMLAIGMNGEPLPVEHGFPARLVIPGLYGYVSATKWVESLEFTKWSDRQAYWLSRGWSEQAPIKTESRIDTPSGFARVPAGKVRLAGTAWAQHTGIAKVEVRLDQGPWQPATLSAEVSKDTWRMWWIELDVPKGTHQAFVRATDQDGYTQTENRADPVPDGATGWHSVSLDAS